MIEVDIGCIRDARRSRSIHSSLLNLLEDSMLKAIAHGSHLLFISAVQSFFGKLRGPAQPDDSRDVLRSCAAGALVAAPVEQRLDASSLLHIQRADTLRCV